MKKIILKWCFKKVLRYLGYWRIDRSKSLTTEQWTKNNDCCQYLYRFIKDNEIY